MGEFLVSVDDTLNNQLLLNSIKSHQIIYDACITSCGGAVCTEFGV